MIRSILESIKKLHGVGEDDHHFDEDLIMHINTGLAILVQIGVGPEEGFAIEGSTEEWEDFLGGDLPNLSGIKSYLYLKTKPIFDPSSSSTVAASLERMEKELEWRLNVAGDTSGID